MQPIPSTRATSKPAASATTAAASPRRGGIRWVRSIPFLLMHLAAGLALLVDFHWELALLALGSYYFRMFFVTVGYHRYFSHRSFRTSRAFQFLLAFMAQTSAQKGALWWASHHRQHHAFSDQENDVHSPVRQGFWWAHVGWILSSRFEETDWKRIKDFARYPELVFLNRHPLLPAVAYAVVVFLLWGFPGLVWGFFVSTLLLYHGTFVINSLAHVVGRSRFPTGDTSKNSLALALITMGEGWHNNHHHFQTATRQGFYPWEIDLSWYGLKALSWVGLVKDLREPPARILQEGRRRGHEPAAAPAAAAAGRQPQSPVPAGGRLPGRQPALGGVTSSS